MLQNNLSRLQQSSNLSSSPLASSAASLPSDATGFSRPAISLSRPLNNIDSPNARFGNRPGGIQRLLDVFRNFFKDMRARPILRQPPFEPNNINRFTPQTYENAPPLTPAPAKPFSEQSLRSDLSGILKQRFPRDSKAVQQGLETFDDPALKKTIPDPRLRAGLVSLQGTAGENAIDVMKSGHYESLQFADLGDTIGMVVRPDPNGKQSILLNEKFQHEDPRLLGVTISHETLHQDREVSGKEELAAYAMHSMIYGQMALESPSLSQADTELTRRMNTQLLARLNSRDAKGQLRLFESQGNVFPGGRPLENFGALFPNRGEDTPGNPALDAQLSAITGKPVSGANFDDQTLALLDQNQKLLRPHELVQLSQLLELNTTNRRR